MGTCSRGCKIALRVLYSEYACSIEVSLTSCCHQVPTKPNARTVQRALRSMGFANVAAKRKPLLSQKHMLQRRRFASKHMGWSVARWSKVIFSDEKIFRVRPGQAVRCWWRKNESRFVAKYTIATTQQAQGVMVWAAMRGNGSIVLRRCPPKVKAVDYQAILESAKAFIRPR